MAYQLTARDPLGGLVSALRAVAHLHQSHHWQAHGPNFYGDHQLFERLYTTASEDIDPLAERAVGLLVDAGAVDVRRLIAGASRYASEYAAKLGSPNEAMVRASLAAERAFVDLLAHARQLIAAREGYMGGTLNLLDGIADRHEQSIYLLQQRLA